MEKLLDKVSEVYHVGVITISDTADSLDVPMETQVLEPACMDEKIIMKLRGHVLHVIAQYIKE
jgi:hypothetical protein